MAATYKNRFLRIMRDQEKALTAVFTRAARLSQSAIVRHSVGDVVPRGATKPLQQDIGRIVENVFIGTVPQSGHRAPFYIRNGDVMPLSPYMFVLWDSIDAVTELAVQEHAAIIERYMPDDIIARARAAASTTVFEFDDGSSAEHVSEFPKGFKSNPFAEYEPAHTWVDPNGYRLSDRIWNTSDNMRGRMDAFIAQSIREGKGALRMSKELEQFMIPGRGLRTKRPYGQNASFEAMRLARTETTRAHASAFEAASLANPFVTTVNIVLSRSHPKRDICDIAAAGSPYPKDDIPERYKIPLHPHCLCHYTANVDEDIDDIVDRARERIKKAESRLQDEVGPWMVDAFKQRLLQGAQIRGPAPFFDVRVVPFGAAAPTIPTAVIPVITPPTVPTVVAPVKPAPRRRKPAVAVTLDTSEGAAVRKEVLAIAERNMNVTSAAADASGKITAEIEGIGNQIRNIRTHAFNPALSESDQIVAHDAAEFAIKALTRKRTKLIANAHVAREDALESVADALFLPDAKRSAMTLRPSAGLKKSTRLTNRQADAVEFVNKVTADFTVKAKSVLTRSNRASATTGNKIKLRLNSDTKTIVHELGHLIEDERGPAGRAKRLKWFNKKTDGDDLEWLDEAYPGYGYRKDEIFKRDKFTDRYTGKIYDFDSDKFSSSEIVSMGIQKLWQEPLTFAQTEPDFFDFIVSYLRGTL